ncbi:MAG: hypothetical protein QGG15_02710 [Dehalococcoidales bacterium]|nr:hypothetical protein [Dehalococcoidales bacterium]MDP6737923.1 hypothetical protein [Dehalococcoidales bacterium]
MVMLGLSSLKSKVQSTWKRNGKGYIVYIASLLAVVALIGNVKENACDYKEK